MRTLCSIIAVGLLGCGGAATTDNDLVNDGKADSAQAVSGELLTSSRKLLAERVPAYYGADGYTFGVVTVVGKPKISATGNADVVHAVGTFEDNELWGGAWLYRFDVNLNLKTGWLTPLAKPVELKEIN
jgi:hypothetical protein